MSLSTDVITVIALPSSVTSVANVRAAQRKQSPEHRHDSVLKGWRAFADTPSHGGPAQLSEDEVLGRCPLPSCVSLRGVSLHHPVPPEAAQKESLPRQLCKVRGLVFSSVVLGGGEQASPEKRQRLVNLRTWASISAKLSPPWKRCWCPSHAPCKGGGGRWAESPGGEGTQARRGRHPLARAGDDATWLCSASLSLLGLRATSGLPQTGPALAATSPWGPGRGGMPTAGSLQPP